MTVTGGLREGEHVELDPLQRRVLTAVLSMQRQSWEQGVLGHALLDLGLGRLVQVFARDAAMRQTAAGKLAELEDHCAVNCAPNAEVVRAAGLARHDAGLLAAYDRQLAWIEHTAPRADDGTVFHLEDRREVWVDTVYMVLPPLVQSGRVEAAAAQLAGHRRRLFDESAHLYAHQWDEASERLVRAAHWGTGNGWVVAGIARALHGLGPDGGAFRAEAAGHAREIVDACLPLRASSGLFHDVLDDPETFQEVNLAQMLAYGIFTGVADGWLPVSYLEEARSLVATARDHVDGDGLLAPACGAPLFDRPGFSVEAQAFFLLATAAERLHQR